MPEATNSLYEQTLVIRSQLGDEQAFAELLKAYCPRLLRFVEGMLRSSPELAPDLHQEIWLAIHRGLPGLLDASKFRPWAFRIARDRVYREFRRRHIRLEVLPDEGWQAIPDAVEEPAEIDAVEMKLCLDELATEQREALLLRFFEGMSYEEISTATGCSIGTVRSRIFYGKRALKSVWLRKEL